MRKRSQQPTYESVSRLKLGRIRKTQSPTLPLSTPRSIRVARSKPWRIVAVSVFLFVFAFNFAHQHFQLSWKWRRKLKKSMLIVKTSIPYFFRHPILTYDIAASLSVPIHSDWHPKLRSERFPSMEERIQLYMSSWYQPPCDTARNVGKIAFTYSNESHTPLQITLRDTSEPTGNYTMVVGSMLMHDKLVLLDQNAVNDCARSKNPFDILRKAKSQNRIQIGQSYCQDMVGMIQSRDGIITVGKAEIPLIVIVGDNISEAFGGKISIPVIAKYRGALIRQVKGTVVETMVPEKCVSGVRIAQATTLGSSRLSPIIWKLNSERHWAPLDSARKSDIPWGLKKNMAVWRGVLTGSNHDQQGLSSFDKCQSSHRCNFVLQHSNSNSMDVGLTDLLDGSGIDSFTHGVKLVKALMSFEDMQEYKVIISLEGNDVSSGLKWQLLSKSVVIMSPPTLTSWAMEELLEPLVHYVPMYQNGSNAEEMLQWVLDHDQEAQKIAERATLFMEDMVYHPDAVKDEMMIKREIIRRYSALWVAS